MIDDHRVLPTLGYVVPVVLALEVGRGDEGHPSGLEIDIGPPEGPKLAWVLSGGIALPGRGCNGRYGAHQVPGCTVGDELIEALLPEPVDQLPGSTVNADRHYLSHEWTLP